MADQYRLSYYTSSSSESVIRREARQAAFEARYRDRVERQRVRDLLPRESHPASLEAAAAHLHDRPMLYSCAEDVYWQSLDRGLIQTWDKNEINSYNPVIVDNRVVMVPFGAIQKEHKYVFPTFDLDAARYRADGYFGIQQWNAVRLDFRYRRPPTPSPEATSSEQELDSGEDEDDGNY
jgi:hypothetical protein